MALLKSISGIGVSGGSEPKGSDGDWARREVVRRRGMTE